MENKDKNKKKNTKARAILLLLLLFVVVAVISFCIVKFIFLKSDKFAGNWSVDGTTYFEFDGKGKGKLKVPTDEYIFSYTIEKNKLHLDYENDKATDSDYEYSFNNDKLHLKGLNTYSGEYELTKQK